MGACGEAPPSSSTRPDDSIASAFSPRIAADIANASASQGDGGTGSPGFALWHFDDCSPRSRILVDSSGGAADAEHALHASCVAGMPGLGIRIKSVRDVIRVPDRPELTSTERIAVAAWIRPNRSDGVRPIIGRGVGSNSPFSLALHDGNLAMSVGLAAGSIATASAPIATGVFTHVAAMYDGTALSLFVNGNQVASVPATGPMLESTVPIQIGAAAGRHFDGVLDEVFLSTQFEAPDSLSALACIRRPFTFSVQSPSRGAVPPGTTLHYDFTIVDRDSGFCPTAFYDLEPNTDPSLSVGSLGQIVNAGTTFTLGMDITGAADADPGPHNLTVRVDKTSIGISEKQPTQVLYDVAPPAACFVSRRAELMITTTSVVDDAIRTQGDGAFSFAHLLRQIAPTEDAAPALLEHLLSQWLTDQTINGFVVKARPAMQPFVLDVWPRTPSGALDLERAPLRLQAIVNRVDLRDLGRHSAGEARFVFAFIRPSPFTLILEYNLPAETQADVQDWAQLWHALSSAAFDSEAYRVALESLTRRFTSRNASPAAVNGSALLRLRTNEVAIGDPEDQLWELRQFELSPVSGLLEEAPVAETPDNSLNGSAAFADFVNQNEAAIIAAIPGSSPGLVPATFEGSPFLGGSSINQFPRGSSWSAPGITNPVARFHASINTCNGCHGFDTRSIFLQITPREAAGEEAHLSNFLVGITVQGPGGPFVLNDLARRRTDLLGLVCPP